MGILVHKFGRNAVITTATDPEDLWLTGGLVQWQTTAATITIAGGDAADDGTGSVGAGANEVLIEGLDGDWNPVSERVLLNGVAAVASTKTFIRVFRAYVTKMGTYHEANTGAIVATYTGGSDGAFTIGAGLGQTEIGHYSIPAGKIGLLHWAKIRIDSGKTATIHMHTNPNANDVTSPFSGAKRLALNFLLAEAQDFSPPKPLTLSSCTDLWFEIADVSATTAAYVEFLLEIV